MSHNLGGNRQGPPTRQNFCSAALVRSYDDVALAGSSEDIDGAPFRPRSSCCTRAAGHDAYATLKRRKDRSNAWCDGWTR